MTVDNANVWAAVSQIFPAANAAQHTVTVKLALPPGAPAAPGMYARAWIAQAGGGGPSALAPAIPNNAIAYRGSLPVAFVVNAARRRDAHSAAGRRRWATVPPCCPACSAGERVVVNPAPDLKVGRFRLRTDAIP